MEKPIEAELLTVFSQAEIDHLEKGEGVFFTLIEDYPQKALDACLNSKETKFTFEVRSGSGFITKN